jgi:flagellin
MYMMGSNGSVDNIKRNINRQTEELNRSNNKLASGKRITKASDDAAGLAIADKLQADSVQLSQASRNIADGGSLSEIQDGVYSSLSDIGSRLSELATQSSNGTLSDAQRSSLNQEFQALSEEATRIVASSSFNGQNVFSGSTTVQVGTDSSASSSITLSDPKLGETVAALRPLSIDSQANAQNTLSAVQSFSDLLSRSRGDLGAQQARLDTANSSVQVQSDAAIAAESRIRDLDYAEEVSKRAALLIAQDSSTALLAQANKLNASLVQKLIS